MILSPHIFRKDGSSMLFLINCSPSTVIYGVYSKRTMMIGRV